MDLINIFGYIDPGTGSIIIQSVIGVVAGVAIFGRRVISSLGHKIRTFFSRFQSSSAPNSTDRK